MNPGERIELAVTLKNYGTATANAVTCRLSPRTTAGIQVIDADAAYGNIAAGGTATGDAPFVFDVPGGVADGTEIVFQLVATSGANSWTSEARLTAGAPSLSFVSAAVNDGGRRRPRPRRGGHAHGDPLERRRSRRDVRSPGRSWDLASGLTVTDAAGSWGTIAADGTGSNAGNTFSVSAAVGRRDRPRVHDGGEHRRRGRALAVRDLPARRRDAGRRTTRSGPTRTATSATTTRTRGTGRGRRTRGSRSIPEYGGSGTDLGLGYENITTVALPFTFTYYGQDYTDIAVCSNGDVGLGGAPVWEHQPRNTIIPCQLGPDAMIAPFWDELVPSDVDTAGSPIGHGDVFTKSLPDGRFVVEWSRLGTFYDNGGAYQTFELVLYDPAQHPTATGDGEILFQYHTIADIEPENRATVGIEDPDQCDGVLYSFFGIRPPEAAALAKRARGQVHDGPAGRLSSRRTSPTAACRVASSSRA